SIIAIIFGIIWIGLRSALSLASGKEIWVWFISYTMLYQALMLPKTTVLITDKFDQTYSATVDNVPYGLAVIGSYTSQIGNGIAELFDQTFSLPDDQNYSKNGFLFGTKVIEQASALKISDSEFAANMSQFIQQCVFYDIKSAHKY